MDAVTYQSDLLTVTWRGSLADVQPQHWDPLFAGRSFFLSRDWLLGAEGELTRQPRYLLVSADGDDQPWAAAAGQFAGADAYQFYDIARLVTDADSVAQAGRSLPVDEAERLAVLAAQARARLPEAGPAMVIAASGMAGGLGIRADLSPGQRAAAAAAAVAAVAEQGRRIGAWVDGFCYLRPGADPELTETLERAGYIRGTLAAECILPIAFNSVDGYLATLPRRRRSSVRREMRQFRDAGMRVEIGEVDALRDELAALQAELRRRYGHPADETAIRRSFQLMRDRLGRYVRVAVARDGTNQVVGFVLFFEADRVYYVKSAGFRYEALQEHLFCYFNVAYYALIQAAAANGIRAIHYGIESYQAKAARGCRLEELVGYVRFAGPCAEALREAFLARSLMVRKQVAELTASGNTAIGNTAPEGNGE